MKTRREMKEHQANLGQRVISLTARKKLILKIKSWSNLQIFDTREEMFGSLRTDFRTYHNIEFRGTYTVPNDPLVSDRECINMVAKEIWKVTGYRFT
ncbi:hypothetical protein L208DRAFT_1510024 [Tricholoma matsutake]|nr:hypothetical protein L208DRAFT_1510024 [Tricholoma matsutake 945]